MRFYVCDILTVHWLLFAIVRMPSTILVSVHMFVRKCVITRRKNNKHAERKTEPTAFTQSSYRIFWSADRSVSQSAVFVHQDEQCTNKLQKLSCTQNKWQCVRDIRNRYKHTPERPQKVHMENMCILDRRRGSCRHHNRYSL